MERRYDLEEGCPALCYTCFECHQSAEFYEVLRYKGLYFHDKCFEIFEKRLTPRLFSFGLRKLKS